MQKMEIDCKLLHVVYQCATKKITLIFSKIKKQCTLREEKKIPLRIPYFSFDVSNQQIHENNGKTKTRLAVCYIVC